MSKWFPLDWPEGFPRSPDRQPSKFKTSFSKALEETKAELGRVGAVSMCVSTNLPLARDGWPDPRSRLKNEDPGVALYWILGGKEHVIACDAWDRIEDNLHAITLTLAADRGKSRWRCSDVVDRAMKAYLSLPPPVKQKHWAEVLGVRDDADFETIEMVYRAKLKRLHPDAGGTHEQMAELNRAIEEARKEKQNGGK